MSTMDDDTLLERSWEYREETLYRRLFGNTGPGIYPIDMDLLRNVFKQEQIDPRWLHVGVNACPPHGDRRHWIYVSSGLSNPWEGRHEDGDSGLGIELMLETQEEATWALTTLRWFTAYHLLLCHSRMPGNPLAPWDRLKLGGPVDHAGSMLQAAVFVPSLHFPGPQQLPSGRFDFLQLLPLTLDEHAFGRAQGFEVLVAQLRTQGAAPVVDPQRVSIDLAPALALQSTPGSS
ncbi:suppressor of fused domain protein [Stenotrophomonas maltophilia]|nr:suppressor of fused domain protein [Stenotrophomonas maltophilia]HDS1826272.1 suppressor of fused domain protein [Stenotrophomonas maltophilia]